MKSLEYMEQTGRTTRMIEEANKRAEAGQTIFILTHNHDYTRDLKSRHAFHPAVKFVARSARAIQNIGWVTGQIGLYGEGTFDFFADHAVFELEFIKRGNEIAALSEKLADAVFAKDALRLKCDAKDAAMKQMAQALNDGEWADLLTTDNVLSDLEAAIGAVLEELRALQEAAAPQVVADERAKVLEEAAKICESLIQYPSIKEACDDANLREAAEAIRTSSCDGGGSYDGGGITLDPSVEIEQGTMKQNVSDGVDANWLFPDALPVIQEHAWYHGITEKHFEQAMYAYARAAIVAKAAS